MQKRRIITAALALAVCSGTLAASPANAATQSKSCTDGAKRTWKAKAVWGAPYVAPDGTTKVSINYVGWTTGAQTLKTQAVVKTYKPNGTLMQTLTRDRAHDYNAGTAWIHRNPVNPPSKPGQTKITLKVGLHGTADCTVTFVQPSSMVSTAPTPTAKTEAADAYGWGTPTAGDEFNYVGAPNPDKWVVYQGPGHAGNGTRDRARWHVNGTYAQVDGLPTGSGGGMSSRFDRADSSKVVVGATKGGRWETRMRVYGTSPTSYRCNLQPGENCGWHPVLIVWPDGQRTCDTQYQEIDYSESTTDVGKVKTFLHSATEGCSKRATAEASRIIDQRQWHNYAVEWETDADDGKGHVTTYVDGRVLYHTTDPAKVPNHPSHSTIQLDNFLGNLSESHMDVDWTRYWAHS